MDDRTFSRIYKEAAEAEAAWTLELERAFRHDAGNARYDARGQGAPGSALRAAADRWTRADKAVRAAFMSRRRRAG